MISSLLTRRDEEASLLRDYAVSVVKPETLDSRMLASWDSLYRDLAQPNPFFSPWFLRPAMRWLDPERSVHLILIKEPETGLLCGLMPVVVGPSYARIPMRHLSVWKNEHLYLGTPLVRSGHTTEVVRAVIDWIGTCPMGICFLRLTQLPADGPVHRALKVACQDRGRPLFVQKRQQRAILHGFQDFDAVLNAATSSKGRAELRRRLRRFGDLGSVSLEERTITEAEARALAEDFLRLESSGWKQSEYDGFALAKTEAGGRFLVEAMTGAAARGEMLGTVLALDDKPVAISLSLRGEHALFGFKTGFDVDYARFSPGIHVLHEATRRMLGDGKTALYDSCAKAGHPVLDTLWPDRQEVLQVNIPAGSRWGQTLLRVAVGAEATADVLLRR
jgi:hypothetical protein